MDRRTFLTGAGSAAIAAAVTPMVPLPVVQDGPVTTGRWVQSGLNVQSVPKKQYPLIFDAVNDTIRINENYVGPPPTVVDAYRGLVEQFDAEG